MAESDPGGLWTKSVYDGAGRDVTDYTTDGGGPGQTTWAHAATVTNDTVLEQVQTVYDGDGNVTETIDRQRFHSSTGTGPLGTPTGGIWARVYYAANYYDNADRLIASVDAGTNGGTAWTRPGSVPASSPTLLVTNYAYSYDGSVGAVLDVIDPMGIYTRYIYDNLGQVLATIQDWTGQAETAESNILTDTYYDGDNNLVAVVAYEPGGSYQYTRYYYDATTANGSAVNSNDILRAIQYPDPSSGQPSTTLIDYYQVNALGQTVQYSDRNGNVHQYGYDVLGRETSDNVTTLGAGVDGTVRQITYGYDSQGNLSLITSLNGSGNVLNQVLGQYNGLGQQTGEWQQHYGKADTQNRPEVVYGYNEMSGGENNSRLTGIEDPSGYLVDYNYNTGLDDSISRLSSISDSGGTLESYKYLGLDTVVERDHPQNNVNQTFISQNGQTGDAGDQYTGLDRFGRVVDQNWYNTTTHSSVDNYTYSYNADSEVLSRDNTLDAALNESYGYNNLGELTSFQRGSSYSRTWTPDALGNFTSVTTNGSTQTRTANQQNEYTYISTNTAVSYDANGNLLTDGTGWTYTYDAWNRLISASANGAVIAKYAYDGLNRQVQITENGGTTDLYYSFSGQVIEEYGSNNTVVTAIDVWSPVYVNALVYREQGGVRYYALQDANWNVTAWVDASGNVAERYAYDAYGIVTTMDANWNVKAGTTLGGMPYGFQGMRDDWWVGNLNFSQSGRVENPGTENWQQPDPLGLPAGNNDYEAFGNQPTDMVDPSGLIVPGEHHAYPLYLGGSVNQPLFDLTGPQHTAAHRVFSKYGLSWNNKDARAAWLSFTVSQRRAIIKESLQAAGIPEPMIKRYLPKIMHGDAPGVNNSPLRATGKPSCRISRNAIRNAAKFAKVASALGGTLIVGGVSYANDAYVETGWEAGSKLATRVGLGRALQLLYAEGALPRATAFTIVRPSGTRIHVRIVVQDGQRYFTAFHTEERSEWRLVSYLYVIPGIARVQYEETVWDIEPGKVPVLNEPNPGEK